jgi:hypothetical protein
LPKEFKNKKNKKFYWLLIFEQWMN